MKVIFTIWNLKKEVYKWKLIFQENYVGNWGFDWKSWIVDFISFTSLMADLRQVKTWIEFLQLAGAFMEHFLEGIYPHFIS